MVESVSNATSTQSTTPSGSSFLLANGDNTQNPASIFSNLPTQNSATNMFSSNPLTSPMGNNYSNDFLMQGMDFSRFEIVDGQVIDKGAQSIPAQNPTPALTQPQVQSQGSAQGFDELNNFLVNPQPQVAQAQTSVQSQKSGFISSNPLTVGGATLGFLAPIGGRVIDAAKSGSFTKFFSGKNLAVIGKQLAITCPLVAIAGFTAGSILDGIFGSKKQA